MMVRPDVVSSQRMIDNRRQGGGAGGRRTPITPLTPRIRRSMPLLNARGRRGIIQLPTAARPPAARTAGLVIAWGLGLRLVLASELAVGDGGLRFWGALAEVYSEIRQQRCRVHKLANILDKLPKRLQPRANALLHGVMLAPTRAGAKEAAEVFAREPEVCYAKAAACLLDDQEALFSFYDFPVQQWIHL